MATPKKKHFRFHCWACQVGIDQSSGVSIAGPQQFPNGATKVVFHVCQTCWDAMTPFERTVLSFLLRDREQDGAGLGQFVDVIRRGIAGNGRPSYGDMLDGGFSEVDGN